jgi:hypothetical protein
VSNANYIYIQKYIKKLNSTNPEILNETFSLYLLIPDTLQINVEMVDTAACALQAYALHIAHNIVAVAALALEASLATLGRELFEEAAAHAAALIWLLLLLMWLLRAAKLGQVLMQRLLNQRFDVCKNILVSLMGGCWCSGGGGGGGLVNCSSWLACVLVFCAAVVVLLHWM